MPLYCSACLYTLGKLGTECHASCRRGRRVELLKGTVRCSRTAGPACYVRGFGEPVELDWAAAGPAPARLRDGPPGLDGVRSSALHSC